MYVYATCDSTEIKGVFTLIHLNAHWTKSHQTALDQFAFAPFTLWLLKSDYEKLKIILCRRVIIMKIYLKINAIKDVTMDTIGPFFRLYMRY